MSGRIFGEIPGVPEGSTFANRNDLFRSGVHGRTMAGISGTIAEGADAIMMSSAYEDDVDMGDVVLYTGEGGRDPESGRQIVDQELRGQNLALAKSCIDGKPVRVIRRTGYSAWAPTEGLRYDGLYWIEDFWTEVGFSGFKIWRYLLVKRNVQPEFVKLVEGSSTPLRVQREVIGSATVDQVRDLYRGLCQVCATKLETSASNYSEGMYLRPLLKPHIGRDELENVLCLCPNHHVGLEFGGLVPLDDQRVLERSTGKEIGRLTTLPEHRLDVENIRYRRNMYKEA